MPPKSFINIKKKEVDTTIILKDIQPEQLDKDFNIKELIVNKQQSSSTTTTSANTFITKKPRVSKKNAALSESKNNEVVNITSQLENLGLIKEQKKFEPTMIKTSDLSCKNGPKIILSFNKESLDSENCIHLHCWWCRHSIPPEYQVLGCPLRYSDDIFNCEGSFCSFNCIKAYIEDKNHYNMKYRESVALTLLYYSKIFNQDIIYSTLFPAPHWSLLKVYGGNLEIEEFRNEFQRVQYYGPSGSLIRDITKPLKTAFTFVERK